MTELLMNLMSPEAFPTDELLTVGRKFEQEIKRRTDGRMMDSGGGRGGRDFWLRTIDPDADRRLVAEIMGQVAPDTIYTVELLDS
jgi:hypothetical protein